MRWLWIEAALIVVLVSLALQLSMSQPATLPPTDTLVEMSGLVKRVQIDHGETTGYGLALADDQQIEIDFKSFGFIRRFSVGKPVTVQGYFKTVKGIEIPSREVFVVTNMNQALVEVRGIFETVMAAGGETTGKAVKRPDGKIVEIDMTTMQLDAEFAPGKEVTVQGAYTTVQGIVRESRKVLVVDKVRFL